MGAVTLSETFTTELSTTTGKSEGEREERVGRERGEKEKTETERGERM